LFLFYYPFLFISQLILRLFVWLFPCPVVSFDLLLGVIILSLLNGIDEIFGPDSTLNRLPK